MNHFDPDRHHHVYNYLHRRMSQAQTCDEAADYFFACLRVNAVEEAQEQAGLKDAYVPVIHVSGSRQGVTDEAP